MHGTPAWISDQSYSEWGFYQPTRCGLPSAAIYVGTYVPATNWRTYFTIAVETTANFDLGDVLWLLRTSTTTGAAAVPTGYAAVWVPLHSSTSDDGVNIGPTSFWLLVLCALTGWLCTFVCTWRVAKPWISKWRKTKAGYVAIEKSMKEDAAELRPATLNWTSEVTHTRRQPEKEEEKLQRDAQLRGEIDR